MKTLHTAYRVQDLQLALGFYETVGFCELGRVTIGDDSVLVMLNLPGDGAEVTLELVYKAGTGPIDVGTGFSHIAVQVDDLESKLADLRAKGVACGELERPGGKDGPKTSFV